MKKRNILFRCLLYPFSALYGVVTGVRNVFFDLRILPSNRYPVPVLCVGNIAVGGTGKTPFTEYLIRLLKTQYRVATLSRGYKRKTRGFIIAKDNCSARDVGDEPCQIKQKFPDIIVAVDANRRRGMRRLLSLPKGERPEVVILDDGMQHRYVTPSLTIMLSDFSNLYYEDWILPVGTLRESVYGAYRADIIVVTKCQTQMKPIDLRIIEKNMSLMANQNLYFSKINYHNIEALFPSPNVCSFEFSESNRNDEVLLLTGIANPKPFVFEMKVLFDKICLCEFPDHHDFNMSDILRIDSVFQKMQPSTRKIICTEKDAMRLKTLDIIPEAWKNCLYYVPISIDFLFDRGELFNAQILKHVASTINILNQNVKN